MLLAAAIAGASLISSTANAGQPCMSPPPGDYLKTCRNISVTGPGCAGQSTARTLYGYELRAMCRSTFGATNGQWVQGEGLPISTNIGNGGTIQIQRQICFEIGINPSGSLRCNKYR